IRRELRVQPGRPFDGDALRADVERLKARPGFASAESAVERGPDGVVVTYRLVAAERLSGAGEAARGGDRVAEVRVTGNRRIEADAIRARISTRPRSEEHTSELQSRENLVCRLLLEKKKRTKHRGVE